MNIPFIIKLLISALTNENDELETTDQSEASKQSTQTTFPFVLAKSSFASQNIGMHHPPSSKQSAMINNPQSTLTQSSQDQPQSYSAIQNVVQSSDLHHDMKHKTTFDDEKSKELWMAATNGDKVKCEQMLASGADINYRDWLGYTPLAVAAWKGHHQIAKLLVDQGAEFNYRIIRSGYSPVALAAEFGHHQVLKILAQAGAEADETQTSIDRYGTELVSRAYSEANYDGIKFLVEHGADITSEQDKYGFKIITKTAESGRDDAEKSIFLHQGADLASKAASEFNHDAVHFFVQAIANIHKNDGILNTGASDDENSKIIQFFVNHGNDIKLNARDSMRKYGAAASYVAAGKCEYDVVKWLVQHGANDITGDQDKYGVIFLSKAAEGGQEDVVNLIVANLGPKLITKAAKDLEYGAVIYLNEKGVDLNSTIINKYGAGLVKASSNGDLRVVTWLIERNVDVNSMDRNGDSALALASRNRHIQLVKFLNEKGAEINSEAQSGDKQGNSKALYYACGNGDDKLGKTKIAFKKFVMHGAIKTN